MVNYMLKELKRHDKQFVVRKKLIYFFNLIS